MFGIKFNWWKTLIALFIIIVLNGALIFTINKVGNFKVLTYPISTITYLIMCYIVALYADTKRLGFDLGFLLSLFVTPVLTYLFALFNIKFEKHSISWRVIVIAALLYTIIAGFLFNVPAMAILHETIRNLYFHVPMWFGMIIILFISLYYSVKYLRSSAMEYDIIAAEAAHVGLFLGCIGISTGMLWAKFTWGDWWTKDAKLNGAAISLLIYLAYFVLRGSLDDAEKKAKVSAVYNIFAYVMFLVFIMILPRMTDSLHPGNGGNPGFGAYDLDKKMRMVFYPAIIGWTLLGVWIITIRIRLKKLEIERLEG